jgi:hypothetical protein
MEKEKFVRIRKKKLHKETQCRVRMGKKQKGKKKFGKTQGCTIFQ